MTMTNPLVLAIGLLLAIGLTVGAALLSRRRSAALAAAGVTFTGRRAGRLGQWFALAGVFVLAVAAAGPMATLPVARSAGTVILAMDVSNSMSATDVSPARLAAAKQAALAFIDAQPDSVDIGVVGFDQGALTSSAAGQDRAVTKAAVEGLRVSGGTSLTAAILGSLSAITGTSVTIGKDGELPDLGSWTSATIVLFSDGQDAGGQDSGGRDSGGQNSGGAGSSDALTDAMTIAQNAGIRIETVGVGTIAGTTVEIDGFRLHTGLDADRLTAIAQATGGSYHAAIDGAATLNDVASGIDLRLTVARQPVPLAAAFTGVALALLAAGTVLTAISTGRLV